MAKLIPCLTLLVSSFFLVLFLQETFHRRKMIKRLSLNMKTTRQKPQKTSIITGLLSKFNLDKNEKVKMKIDNAGNPKYIGESVKHYYISKIVLAVFVALAVGKAGPKLVIWGFIGFMFPDFLLYIGAKRRKEEILMELPKMIDYIKKSLVGGSLLTETLAQLPQRLTGPLKEEAERLSARYNITLNLNQSLDIFAKRIGLEEVDNLVLALTQSEKTGKVKELLAQQSELLKTKMEYEVKKETNTKSNLLPLVCVLMVANILILVIAPLLLSIFHNNFFS